MNKVKFFVILLVCILTSCNKEEDPVIIGGWLPLFFLIIKELKCQKMVVTMNRK